MVRVPIHYNYVFELKGSDDSFYYYFDHKLNQEFTIATDLCFSTSFRKKLLDK